MGARATGTSSCATRNCTRDGRRGCGPPPSLSVNAASPFIDTDPFAQFDGHGAAYRDDVRSAATSEPTDEASALALLAFSLWRA
jgi:hypothetical protein